MKGIFGFTKEHEEYLVSMVDAYGIKPIIGKVFEYEDAIAAFEEALINTAVGKIVVKI